MLMKCTLHVPKNNRLSTMLCELPIQALALHEEVLCTFCRVIALRERDDRAEIGLTISKLA